jgi:hypothetical protein
LRSCFCKCIQNWIQRNLDDYLDQWGDQQFENVWKDLGGQVISARDMRAMDQGGQRRDQVDATVGRQRAYVKDWSLTSLKEKLIKIGAKVVSHGRYVVFQMAEVAIPRQMFQEILRLIAELRPQPPRQHEAFDCHAFKRNRQEECVQMPVKIARSTPRPSFGLPELLVASHISRLASRDAAKSLLSTLVSASSGECRINAPSARPYPRPSEPSAPAGRSPQMPHRRIR